ncbi:hypothetical protein [Streptomyces mirabilis]|uniref:hypothetical protein n=1 Tax=Streptomyces mirabilis TaxID=68239 RepID=UPI0036DEAA53
MEQQLSSSAEPDVSGLSGHLSRMEEILQELRVMLAFPEPAPIMEDAGTTSA